MPPRFPELATKRSKEAYELVGGEPGLATQGETMDEARAMAADCLRAYLESLRKDGEPLPHEAPEGPITERLTVELASA